VVMYVWQVRWFDGEGECLYERLHEDGSMARGIWELFWPWYEPLCNDAAAAEKWIRFIDQALTERAPGCSEELDVGWLEIRYREVKGA
jgi:hypothetical protein